MQKTLRLRVKEFLLKLKALNGGPAVNRTSEYVLNYVRVVVYIYFETKGFPKTLW